MGQTSGRTLKCTQKTETQTLGFFKSSTLQDAEPVSFLVITIKSGLFTTSSELGFPCFFSSCTHEVPTSWSTLWLRDLRARTFDFTNFLG